MVKLIVRGVGVAVATFFFAWVRVRFPRVCLAGVGAVGVVANGGGGTVNSMGVVAILVDVLLGGCGRWSQILKSHT